MREYGLIGYPLDHSFSKTYFTNKFEAEGLTNVKYQLFPLSEIGKLQKILESHPKLHGLNVTTPYKELVIPFLDDLDPVALSVGAVNTILIHQHEGNIYLKGYNTDVLGVDRLLMPFDLPEKALVLGSGGSAHAVRYALKLRGISGLTVSRNPNYHDHLGYDELSRQIVQDHQLIINCTPVGMYPNVDRYPKIPFEFLTESHICLDLIYNPEKSLFLEKAEAQGAKIKNGFDMLTEQADKAWEIWKNAFDESQMTERIFSNHNS